MRSLRLLPALLAFLASNVLAQDSELPLTGVWNGFLNQINVVECSNLETDSVSLTLRATDYSGSVRAHVEFDIPASGTKHITLNDYGILDSYGSFVSSSVRSEKANEIRGTRGQRRIFFVE